MERNNFSSQGGQVSRIIIILAAVVLVIMVIVFVALGIAGSRSKQNDSQNQNQNQNQQPVENEPPKPVYEVTLGDVKFIMESSTDLGNTLKSNTTYQPDVKTTERFIKVVVGAQNKSKIALQPFSWDLVNIIDSEGRIFAPITNKAYYFLPKPDLCGAVLYPEFAPVVCTRIYEVSLQSKDLKIQVLSKSPKQAVQLLDLDLPF